jgi:hypothetical protein
VSAQLPFLDVRGPDGIAFQVALAKDRVTIGRLPEINDIALEPDPQRLITRSAHCVLERDRGTWFIVDNGSSNRTFVRHSSTVKLVDARFLLADGDVIRLLARVDGKNESEYWELTFRDPQKTTHVTDPVATTVLQYDATQARLFRVTGPNRTEIGNLRPQEHRLVRYMAQRNRDSGNATVMCSYEELIQAVWGDEHGHTETEINHLVWELRRKIEANGGDRGYFQAVRGLGYRLEIS